MGVDIMELTNWRIEDLTYSPKLLQRTEAVLKFYTQYGYRIINHAFQYGIRPNIQNTFLRYALELAVRVYDEIIVYRGCGESETHNLLHAIENGHHVLDYDFPVSSSLFQNIAEGFVDEVTKFNTEYAAYVGYSALLIIRIPPETPVIYAGALSSCMEEYEVILPPRVFLHIEGVETEFNETDLSFSYKIHARAEVSLREVESEYVDDELVAEWGSRAGVDLDSEFDEE